MDDLLAAVLRVLGRFFVEALGQFLGDKLSEKIENAFLCVGKFFKKVFRKIFGKRVATKKKTERRERGDAGEKFAAEFLKKECGMKILCRNFCAGKDEIDLVARDGSALVFVEVKTRSENDALGAVYAVDARKKQALRRAADAYLRGLRERPPSTRLDVVEVYVRESDGEMRAVHHRGLRFNS